MKGPTIKEVSGGWIGYYIWRIHRDYTKIEKLAEENYSTSHLPQNVSKRNPSEQREFRDIIDYKREAFRHILAAAWFEYHYSLLPTRALGIAKEKVDLLKQKIKEFLGKKSNRKRFKRLQEMDLANNEAGLSLAKSILDLGANRRTFSLPDVALMVHGLIEKGEFYVAGGKMKYNALVAWRAQQKRIKMTVSGDKNPRETGIIKKKKN